MLSSIVNQSSGQGELFEPKPIDVAPAPFLARLDGPRDGMPRCLKVTDRVLVLGSVAAPDVAAVHAHPKLQPGLSDEDTVVATRTARLHVADAIDVRARHWVFDRQHDEWKVRTPCACVESIDDMRFIPRINSTSQSVVPRSAHRFERISSSVFPLIIDNSSRRRH
jgi:hypothetical protein